MGVEGNSRDGHLEEKCCPPSFSTTPPPSGLDMELGQERLSESWSHLQLLGPPAPCIVLS